MDAALRERFNRAWTPRLYENVKADLERRLGSRIPFPVGETPVFLPQDVRDRFVGAAEEIMALLSRPAFIAAHEEAIPTAYRSPGRGALPQLAVIDFAVCRDEEGRFVPRLVELQGFPSLYGFQLLLADVWATHLALLPGMPDGWRLFFGGMDRYRGMALLRSVLLGEHDPDEVILLDLSPATQKTFPDFVVTRHWWGLDAVCPTELRRDGARLLREKEGRLVPVKRIYHRVVIDELERKGVAIPFRFDEQLDVEWVPHPEWWFLWSKLSMLSLDHPACPRTTLLADVGDGPADLSGYVLKPLYSFAGAGVNVDPTPADLAAVPAADRRGWVLQEKVDYAPAFRSVEGDGVKVEMRMMFVRPDADTKMTLLMNLIRLSRGKMMGVDFNKNMNWTGASVGLWPA